jgi:hypothetical protein
MSGLWDRRSPADRAVRGSEEEQPAWHDGEQVSRSEPWARGCKNR